MNRYSTALVVFCCLPFLPGCSGYHIREGVWELSFQAIISKTREPLYIEKHLVKVLVEASSDGQSQVAEISEVSPGKGAGPGSSTADGDPRMQLPPLYADIKVRRRNDPPTVFISSPDSSWVQVNMRGRVDNDRHVVGTHFTARNREEPTVTLEGRWDMRWIRGE